MSKEYNNSINNIKVVIMNNSKNNFIHSNNNDYLLDFETEDLDFLRVGNLEDDNTFRYPYAEIKVERDQYPIFQLYRKYDKGQIILDPEFQRDDVWNSKQKSELIESVLMGIPLPIFYLNESKEGKLVVVDGRQRLTTFFKYLNNEFQLKNLRILNSLNGKKFGDLDPKLQADLEDFQIIAQVIKPPTPDRIKFDIFDRVNRGGTPLNNQEMRNALYQGKSTILLEELSASEQFHLATQGSIKSYRMKDRYLILRALAFYLWNSQRLKDANGELVHYKNDIDEFLGKAMEYINRCTDDQIDHLKKSFYQSMNNNFFIMEDNAFRRSQVGNRKQPINMILFEVMTILMWDWSEGFCLRKKDQIKVAIDGLLDNEEINKLLTVDRGRGIVVPTILEMINVKKAEIENA